MASPKRATCAADPRRLLSGPSPQPEPDTALRGHPEAAPDRAAGIGAALRLPPSCLRGPHPRGAPPIPRAALLVLAGLLVAGPSDVLAGEPRPLTIKATATEVPAAGLSPGVASVGAWTLESDHPAFGGISGLVVHGDRLTAVTDRGRRIDGRIDRTAASPLSDMRIERMRLPGGAAVSGPAADAEGLTRTPDGLRVSFEREHRIMRLDGNRLSAPRVPQGAADLGHNRGMEALATLPDGRLLAIAESRAGDVFPLWSGPRDGPFRPGGLPVSSRHAVTGADATPDGRLYVLQRHYSPATGVSIRLLVYRPGADGLPDPASARLIAAYEDASGIDNMEGVAAVPRAGGVDLWLISDDNFSTDQRTLLVGLRHEPPATGNRD